MNILHYEAISQFKKQFYKDLLTIDHLRSGEVRINKFSYPDRDYEEDVNFWGYKLQKNDTKYLLKSTNTKGEHIRLNNILPILITKSEKVAYQGIAYYLIIDYKTAKFMPNKIMNFKELIDRLSSLSHSNPEHLKLSWFIGLASMLGRCNARISSPPSFGKDSVVDIIGNLIGKSSTIVSPTIAKLEYMTNYKWLAINEVIDIPKDKWRDVEQFLLDAGAFKPEIAKHSRAVSGVNEMLDISEFSLSLLYNDITNYSSDTKYFDSITKDAVKDRFVPFRLYGTFKEDFSQSKKINTKEFVHDHMQEYKDLIYTYTYYKHNFFSELHHYTTTIFDNLRVNGRLLSERWKLNITKILQMIDLYSSTKEDFDKWALLLRNSLVDYHAMLEYPGLLEKKSLKVKGDAWNVLFKRLNSQDTFISKVKILNEKPTSKGGVVDGNFW